MGWFGSSEEDTIESTGTINNNVVIKDSVQIHNDELRTILYIIAGILIVGLIYKIFQIIRNSHKKRYIRQGISMANLDKAQKHSIK